MIGNVCVIVHDIVKFVIQAQLKPQLVYQHRILNLLVIRIKVIENPLLLIIKVVIHRFKLPNSAVEITIKLLCLLLLELLHLALEALDKG
ncbi:hypothetical protein MT325_m821L [Paramecium bursaria chlorella virus MT325]|uniref:Uncharacterized protein m821L n=1 Tax=Paramecium bursaria Chlorella virus MT325 TaxID=346932 RepID=A7IVK1_PBCVM|nr:hypothetical protein MT325_m821L [Paramecium bursaria chlorella virus MT325]